MTVREAAKKKLFFSSPTTKSITFFAALLRGTKLWLKQYTDHWSPFQSSFVKKLLDFYPWLKDIIKVNILWKYRLTTYHWLIIYWFTVNVVFVNLEIICVTLKTFVILSVCPLFFLYICLSDYQRILLNVWLYFCMFVSFLVCRLLRSYGQFVLAVLYKSI